MTTGPQDALHLWFGGFRFEPMEGLASGDEICAVIWQSDLLCATLHANEVCITGKQSFRSRAHLGVGF
ncbi:MAG: hypothetical protein WEA61_01815 [Anaerolineales bacterium]